MAENIAVYLRVSTRNQEADRQAKELRSYLGPETFKNATQYADVGSGAREGNRAQYVRLREDIRNGEVDRLVTYELSRLSRRMAEVADLIEECIDYGVGVETVGDAFPTLTGTDSEMDKLIGQLVAWAIQFEHQMILGRVRSGVQRAINKGKWVGRPPFGFEVVEGYLQVKPEEYVRMQAAIEEAESRTAGDSLAHIARANGVPRSTLSRALEDDERRALYLDPEDDSVDDRVTNATDDVEFTEITGPATKE